MVCEHLAQLEKTLAASGIEETFRGAAWSRNCREWAYFRCWLDRESLRRRFSLAPCVVDHTHRGTHDGQEAGFVCTACHDAVMGVYEAQPVGIPVFR
jgi:hypothetical protein